MKIRKAYSVWEVAEELNVSHTTILNDLRGLLVSKKEQEKVKGEMVVLEYSKKKCPTIMITDEIIEYLKGIKRRTPNKDKE